MWAALRNGGIDHENPVPLSEHVYLGCSQRELAPIPAIVEAKRETLNRLFSGELRQEETPAHASENTSGNQGQT